MTADDLDPSLPEHLRAEAAAWATALDTPTPTDPAKSDGLFWPHPEWEAAEAAFTAARPGLEGRDDPARLLDALPPFDPGGDDHRRAAWLCVNAVRTVRHCWDLTCENPGARAALAAVAGFLRGENPSPDWPALTAPAVALRDGERVSDCDACAVEPIADAAASAAAFARDGRRADGAACLRSVAVAADEGCWPHGVAGFSVGGRYGTPDAPFGAWLVRHALPAAWRCEELPPCEPGVPVWRVVP